ncbi:phage head spike fiber domain-containing protein [Aeromonas salmonicida]|uniref:phage head spike fiber domain-containing protein n=1 Tax=Aeromonas salmonicida TaxID=645 RepID=UPI003D1C9321
MAGVWKRDGTIAVTKGSKKVVGTGTTFADPKNAAAKGHLLVMVTGTAVDLYEVDYSESNSVFYLVEAYRGDTGTGKAYAIDTSRTDSIPEFARRLNATLGAYQQQSDAFQALLTSDAATIEVTAPDGTKHTMIPWKRVTSEGEGQAGRAKAEADKAAASAALAGSIVEVSALPLPDVWAPLSDSLRLITGYGRDVLVGSDVVARMVNFSRSTTKTYRAKDGALKIAAINEPAFEAEGLLVECVSTNIIKHHDIAYASGMSEFGKTADPLNVSDGATVFSITNPENNALRFGDVVVGGASDIKTSSCFVKSIGKAATFIIECEDAAATSVHVEADTWMRITTTRKNPSTAYSDFFDVSVFEGNVGDKISVWGAQLELLPFMTSLILTSGAATTRAADFAWIPVSNSPVGGGVTVAADCDVLALDETYPRIAVGKGLPDLFCVPRSSWYPSNFPSSNNIQIAYSKTNQCFNGSLFSHQINISDDNATQHISLLSQYSSGVSTGFGHIRNLRIWHKELSIEQLKAIA